MESYPEDLLVGVFPLVFAVDALNVEKGPETLASEQEGATAAASPKDRSDFDRFLDAMAGSLVDDGDEPASNDQLEFQPTLPPEGPSGGRNATPRRAEDGDDESSDEDFVLDADGDDENNNNLGGSRKRQSSIRLGFGLNRRFSGGNNSHSSASTSYAKALQHGQGFFQRARIVSISPKHGFPPSKDPHGTKNIAFALNQARASPKKAKELFASRPIQGIIPAGWLEKHVYALPSVVLVVTKLSKMDQETQDLHLLKTVGNLQYSLVPKRPCKIHVVGLVDDDVSVYQAEQWSLKISRRIVENPNAEQHQQDAHQITLLRAGNDLRSGTDGFPTSVALRRLHRTVRDSSLMYYLGLIRRTKEKLAKISESDKKRRVSNTKQKVHPPKKLLPLAIRYCFKIAIYYEFTLNFQKSLKFMSEAYRHVRSYYHHLVWLTRNADLSDDEDGRSSAAPRSDLNVHTPPKILNSNVSISMESEDTEVSLAESNSHTPSAEEVDWISGLPPPPADMGYQCLAVADWLNFKLLQAGFGSHTEGGLHAAAGQWRQHSRVFCARRFLGGHPIMSEDWLFWCQIAHQRLVMSQLVERHPPKALGDFGNEYDEVLFRCTPWRAYEAAAEAFLEAGVSVRRALTSTAEKYVSDIKGEKNDNRAPFLGGLDEQGLAPIFKRESMIDHRERAVEMILRAISLFEREWDKEKLKDAEDQFPHRTWGRFGARLTYLAGGILVAKGSYGDARKYLEEAMKLVEGWYGLELAIRRMLVECYENQVPKDSETEGNHLSCLMQSCFNAQVSPLKLQHVLSNCGSVCSSDSFKWDCQCFDEDDASLPFSFSVIFPRRSHATSGDTVKASMFLRSNLKCAVKIGSITLLSMAGPVQLLSRQLRGGNNTRSGGVTLQPCEEITLVFEIRLPKDLDHITTDDDEKRVGKNPVAKSARPRTAGITAGAGARLVSEKVFGNTPKNSNAQWSLNFLGGKPLRCDGVRIIFCPSGNVPEAKAPIKPVELTIEKKKQKTTPNVKRTSFEEDNYLSSAWSRSLHLPLSSGPRCLRVLGPISEMEISNLTQTACGGKAVEGTVNRICLKLQAGPHEICNEITYKISLASMLVTAEGVAKNIMGEGAKETNSSSMESASARTPILVSSFPSGRSDTCYGSPIPTGWNLVGSGQGSDHRPIKRESPLRDGEATYVFFDIFRPCAVAPGKIIGQDESLQHRSDNICQTDFEVSVSYRQDRRVLSPEDPDLSGDNFKQVSEFVTQIFQGSVTWIAPIQAYFSQGTRNAFPSGSRHPSNLTDEARPSDTSIFTDLPAIDGERLNIKTVLESNMEENGFEIGISKIRFEAGNESDHPCELTPSLSYEDTPGLLYRADKDDPCRWLAKGSKFSFIYNVKVKMKNHNRSATFILGLISVDWRPREFDLPEEVKAVQSEIRAHGPLALPSAITTQFRGPSCYIEKPPFRIQFTCIPSVPKVSVPFEVHYRIANETNAPQKVAVSVHADHQDPDSQGILVSGFVNGDLKLAPFESQVFSYTAISVKPGMITLPIVYASTSRYNSWVINEGLKNSRPLCVLP